MHVVNIIEERERERERIYCFFFFFNFISFKTKIIAFELEIIIKSNFYIYTQIKVIFLI